jgi:methionyl-tRNA formyltransferase
MKIVFFGTPGYVLPIIESLHKKFKSGSGESPIAAVVTQKAKPAGRKNLIQYSPVDTWAHKKKIPIFFDPEKLITDGIRADVGVLASYGKIIPQNVIDYFPHGILNIHPSLLPEFRGASPVQAALVSGLTETGVSIIKLDNLLDHGPIVSQFNEDIITKDTTGILRERLFARSAEVLTTLLPAYINGKVKLRRQNHDKVSFTRQITKNDAFIPPKYLEAALQELPLKVKWEIRFLTFGESTYSLKPTAYNLNNFIRAMQPWPVAWTLIRLSATQGQAKRLKILKSHLEPLTNQQKPNTKHKFVIDEVQLEGKSPVSWKQFLEGYPEAKFS